MNSINELPEGQMGLKMISLIADRLSYTRTPDDRNCLLIVKCYQPIGDKSWQTIGLRVETDLDNLARVLQWYDRLEKLPIPKHVIMQCRLALAEGFTNAVRHAHKSLPLSTPINLEIRVLGNCLELRIWDSGQPFDFEAKISKFRQGKKRQGKKTKYRDYQDELGACLMKIIARARSQWQQWREGKYSRSGADLI